MMIESSRRSAGAARPSPIRSASDPSLPRATPQFYRHAMSRPAGLAIRIPACPCRGSHLQG